MNWTKEACKRYSSSKKGKETRKKYHEGSSYKKISEEYNASDKGKATRKKYRDLWYKTEKGRKYSMWQAAKLRARKKGLEFSVSIEDIQFPEICPLLGLRLSYEDFGIRHNSPSIDRKDSSKGYTKENIWIISSRANMLKNNASLSELESLVKNLKLCGHV